MSGEKISGKNASLDVIHRKKVTSRKEKWNNYKEKCYVLDVVMGTIRHIRLNKTLTSFSFSPNLPSKTIKVIQTQINIINGPLLPTQPYYIMTAITNTVFQKHGKPLFLLQYFQGLVCYWIRYRFYQIQVQSLPSHVRPSVSHSVSNALGLLCLWQSFKNRIFWLMGIIKRIMIIKSVPSYC